MTAPSSPLDAIAYLRTAAAPTAGALFPEGTSEGELDADELPVLTPFIDGLLVSYALDCGDAFELVQVGDLEDASLTPEQLHTAALANLATLAKGRLELRRTGDISALFLDGNFEASLILLDALWDRNLRDCYQQPVIAMPSRDMLAFCDVGSRAGLSQLRKVIERVWPGGEDLISNELYTRVSGKWSIHRET